MERNILPKVGPRFDARYNSSKDVLALLGQGEVTGVNYDDLSIREIRSCVLGNLGRIGMTAALNSGYLHDQGSALHDARVPLLTAWRWWCTAAGHPHIVLSPDYVGLHQVRRDLISAGKRWLPTDVPKYERILGEVVTVEIRDSHFSIDDRVFQITGVEMDDAVSIARNLVEYTTTGAFKQRAAEVIRDPDPFAALKGPLVPMECNDGG